MKQVFDGYRSRLAVLEATYDKNPFARGIAWVEGEFVPLSEARIPLLDEGFMHSDLTYDVPSVWDGKYLSRIHLSVGYLLNELLGRFFRLDDHMTRLESSCHKMRLQLPLAREEVKKLLVEMVAKSGVKDAFVELIVTRGLKGVRGHTRGQVFKNNLYMFIQPYVWVMEPDMQLTGGKAIVARTVKRISPGSFDPTVKNLQWGDLTRGLFEAVDRDAVYPFLTDGDANLTEGSGFNIVLIKDGVLYTPERGVLEGVTRRSVFDVAKTCGVPVRVEFVPTELAYSCDEIFMCTTAGGIMPITELDGKPVKDGKIGPITKKIWDEYWAIHYDSTYSFEIDYEKGAAKITSNSRL